MRRLLPVSVALLVGAGLGAGGVGLALRGDDTGAPPDPDLVRVQPAPLLRALPPGPVEVVTETVRLGAGFTSRHRHGGPTINLIRSGEVEIADADGVRRHGPGETFVEPASLVHTIRVLAPVRIDVVRVLPAGAPATTEVPAPG